MRDLLETNTAPLVCGAIPVVTMRSKDLFPRHVWRRIKARAMTNARLAGLSRAEWERRRMAHEGGPRAADFAMMLLPTYDGARCYLDARGPGGSILDGLTCPAI